MASSSTAESIICAIIDLLNGVDAIRRVEREQISGMDDLRNIPGSRLPLAHVHGAFPSRAPESTMSEMIVHIGITGQDNAAPNMAAISMIDDIYRAMSGDTCPLGATGVAALRIAGDINPMIAAPYYQIAVTLTVEYYPQSGGI